MINQLFKGYVFILAQDSGASRNAKDNKRKMVTLKLLSLFINKFGVSSSVAFIICY